MDEALRRGSKVFLMFNNPADLLAEHLERLLNGRMAEPTEIECIEPDFCFQFSV